MARIRSTYPTTESGRPHREHRSKRGRHKFRAKERFNPSILSPVIARDEEKLDLDELLDFRKVKRKAEGRPTKSPACPKMRCINCGKTFTLPRNNTALDGVICPLCGKNAYFIHYFGQGFLWIWCSGLFTLMRDAIKEGKAKLCDFL